MTEIDTGTDDLLARREGNVGVITFNRPERRNALSNAMYHGFRQVIPTFATDPEIRRSSLAGVILRMKSLGLPEIDAFPFLDPPSPKAIAEGYRTLREVGALDRDRELTERGRTMARLPVDPRLTPGSGPVGG